MKEIYIEKVKINKVGTVLYFIGSLLMFISGIVLLFKTGQTDRVQIMAWIFLGLSGYILYSKFDTFVYSRIKKPKEIKKINKKNLNKFANYFILLFAIVQVTNIVTFFYLLSTDLPNLAIFLLHFPIVFGWATLIIVYGTALLLWKNNFELNKIIKKLKKRTGKEDKR